MGGYNLPDDVTEGMLPGNTKEDMAAERARDAREDAMNDLADGLDGQLMSFAALERVLDDNADLMRDVWEHERELLFIGFGMNDGDTDFTVSAEWRKP